MTASSTLLHDMSLADLERACREQTLRYRRQQVSDERYCLEVFRRAVRRGDTQNGEAGTAADEEARELLVLLYTEYVRAQISRKVYGLVPLDDVIQEAWFNFWRAAAAKALVFPSLGAALTFLQWMTIAAVTTYVRKARSSQREESLQAMIEAHGGEPFLVPGEDIVGDYERRRFRVRCFELLTDRVDRLIFYLRFGLDYKPREIARWLNEHLEGRTTEYTARRVGDSLERSKRLLRDDLEIRDLLRSD